MLAVPQDEEERALVRAMLGAAGEKKSRGDRRKERKERKEAARHAAQVRLSSEAVAMRRCTRMAACV